MCFFFCKQKTAYERRISDWSSDVCSSDLLLRDETVEDTDAVRLLAEEVAVGGEEVHRARVAGDAREKQREIGRETRRERVCQYVWISAVAVSVKKRKGTE